MEYKKPSKKKKDTADKGSRKRGASVYTPKLTKRVSVLGVGKPGKKKKKPKKEVDRWCSTSLRAVAICNFEGNAPKNLQLQLGDIVVITHAFMPLQQWYRGSIKHKPNQGIGIFPASFVHILEEEKKDGVIAQLRLALRKWVVELRKYFLDGKHVQYHYLKKTIEELLSIHAKLTGGNQRQQATEKLKQLALEKIEECRRRFGVYKLLRNAKGEVLTHNTMPLMELYAKHANNKIDIKNEKSYLRTRARLISHLREGRMRTQRERSDSMGREKLQAIIQKKTAKSDFFTQIAISFRCLICDVGGEESECYFSLFSTHLKTFITEEYCVSVTVNGLAASFEQGGLQTALFRDISAADFSSDLCIVCRIIRKGKLKKKNQSTGLTYRRPYGVAVFRGIDFDKRGVMDEFTADVLTVSGPSENYFSKFGISSFTPSHTHI